MKLATLEAFGINEEIISIWQKYIKDGTLLPVQVKAIKEFGLFEGKNILVFSPTSYSGIIPSAMRNTIAGKPGKRFCPGVRKTLEARALWE